MMSSASTIMTQKSAKIIEELQNLENKRKLWRTFDTISNRKKKTKTEIKHLLIDGQKITNPQEIANNLNNHFNQIGQQMANDIKRSGKFY